MFRYFHNIRQAYLKKTRQLLSRRQAVPSVVPQKLSAQKGQVAVILIFIIAIGLIFYAATSNFSKLSLGKTLTIRAANTAASSLASMFASWGQKLSEEYLNGNRVKCKKVSAIGIIIKIIIAIILIVIGILCEGCTWYAAVALVVAGVAMAYGAYVQAVIIPGALADMWNRMMANLTTSGRFMETGLQTGLRNVVTDQVDIPDLLDMDLDGIWGMTGTVPNDTVPRFAYYYTRRLQQIPAPNTAAIQAFLDALTEIWSPGADNWALMDPLSCATSTTHPCCRADRFDPATGLARLDFPAECDPCCVEKIVDGDLFRPECCDLANGDPNKCGDPSSCTVRSLYYADSESSPNNYPYVYQPLFYENSLNSFFSFRELLGRDDEHHLYHVRQSQPNTHRSIPAGRQYLQTPAYNQFILQDATGYYRLGMSTAATPPPGTPFFTNPPQVQDDWRGIFPFFYKTENPGWGVELNPLTLTYTNDQCHWCDPRGDGTAQGAPLSCAGPPVPVLPPEIPRLSLGVTTLGTYSGGWCVDVANPSLPGRYPVILDRVAALPGSLFAAPGDCAQTIPETGNPGGGWKAGSDRFCSPSYPYEINCPKHGAGCTEPNGVPGDCLCGEAGAGAAAPDPPVLNTDTYMGWPDDNLDDIISGLPAFLGLSSGLLNGQALTLSSTFSEWYLDIADWIEPACDPTPGFGNDCTALPCVDTCPNSYTDLEREGVLWTWRRAMESFRDPIRDWVFPPAGSEYEGASCTVSPPGNPDDVWCIPPSQVAPNNYGINECAYVQPVEAATFDVNGNGTRGDLEDVVACLNWNANDVRTYVGGAPPATGNAEKFQRCSDVATCSSETCSQLPRCLVPAFYAPWPPFVDPTDPIYPLFVTCRDSATVDLCSANCSQPAPLPSGPPYNLPPWFPPNLAQIAAFDATVADFFTNTCTIDPFAIITICDTDNAGGTDLNCGSTAGEVAACKCSWYNSCAGFPSPAGCGGDATYYNAVAVAASALGGACAQTGPGQFIDVVRQCEAEARIQVPKLRKRYHFLNNRLQEALAMIDILSGAIDRLTDFLDNGTPWGTAGIPNPPNTQDSPAENLIDARINASTSGDLPSVVIYAWQDDLLKKPRADGSYTGYWHAVKVEARFPSRCNNACGLGGGGDPPWPSIRAYKKGGTFNRKICYEMDNTEGMVKARVVRYDEDQDPQNIFFPGGERIWAFRNYHPAVGPGNPFGIEGTCQPYIDPDIFAMGAPYANAFMLNRPPTQQEIDEYAGGADNYFSCWRRVHENMLRYGVSTEACAQYTWGEGSPGVGRAGMRVKFIPCDTGFLNGSN